MKIVMSVIIDRYMTKKSKTIQVIDRAAALLEHIAHAPEGMALTELARATELTPQTVQSILRTLERNGYVFQQGRGAPYLLGDVFHNLYLAWERQHPRLMRIQDVVRQLNREVNEYVILTALRNERLVGVVEMRGRHELAVNIIRHDPARMHVLATGKVLLAYMDESQRARFLDRLSFASYGPGSVMSLDALERQLAEIRRKGYVVAVDESSVGAGALAVPVRDSAGVVIQALGLYLPLVRLDKEREAQLIAMLQDAARQIEEVA